MSSLRTREDTAPLRKSSLCAAFKLDRSEGSGFGRAGGRIQERLPVPLSLSR